MTLAVLLLVVAATSHDTPTKSGNGSSALPMFHLRRRPFFLHGSHGQQQPHRRQLRGGLEAETHRESDGVYFTTLRVGTPPQDFSVIIDTGSNTVSVPCAGCERCGRLHSAFNASASGTAVVTDDYFEQCYSEGSCNSGRVVRDRMCIGAGCTPSLLHDFGCCDRYAGAFQEQDADGIIGLSRVGLLADLRPSMQTQVFSLCLGEKEGFLTVGGWDAGAVRENVQWVPCASDRTKNLYTVWLASIQVAGDGVRDLAIDAQLIVDSGTSFTYLPAEAHALLAVKVRMVCNGDDWCRGRLISPDSATSSSLPQDVRDSPMCIRIRKADGDGWMDHLPSFLLKFGEGQVCVPPRTYLFESSTGVQCVGIFSNTYSGSTGKLVILGANLLSGLTVVFDYANARVGFARSDCDGSGAGDCRYTLDRGRRSAADASRPGQHHLLSVPASDHSDKEPEHANYHFWMNVVYCLIGILFVVVVYTTNRYLL